MISSYSPDNSVLVIVTNDSRLIVLDTTVSNATPRNLSEGDHLTKRYQCLEWGQSSSDNSLHLFLGCYDGSVSVIDVRSMSFVTSLKPKFAAPILSMSVDMPSRRLFATTGDTIHDFDLVASSFAGSISTLGRVISSIKTLPSNRLIIAGHQIITMDIASQLVQTSLTGHTSPVDLLHLFNSMETPCLVSSSSNRFLNVWNLATSTLLCVLQVDNKPMHINSFVNNETVYITVVSSRKVLSLFSFSCEEILSTSSTPRSPSSVFSIDYDSGDVVAATIKVIDGTLVLALGRHDSRQTVTQSFPMDTVSHTMNLEPLSDKELSFKTGLKKSSDGYVIDSSIAVEGRVSDSRGLKAVKPVSSFAADGTDRPQGTNIASKKPFQQVSVAQALSLAVRSNDVNLLNKCLSSVSSKHIPNSVQELSSEETLSLLQMLVHLIDVKPERAPMLLTWTKAILTSNAGGILSNPKSAKVLQSVKTVLTLLSSNYNQLVALKSKLEVAFALSKDTTPVSDSNKGPLISIDAQESDMEDEGEMAMVDDDDDLLNEITHLD
ncbi:hypothetical protein GEMRC1_002144 [Eukaryota sp. GEM-RC1]